ncbi:hypothetical protein GCM10010234_54470 [Streptomyces hawaiiensis]
MFKRLRTLEHGIGPLAVRGCLTWEVRLSAVGSGKTCRVDAASADASSGLRHGYPFRLGRRCSPLPRRRRWTPTATRIPKAGARWYAEVPRTGVLPGA